MAVVGLDFGYMNAVVAQAERGGVTVLLNENSKRLNACQVSFQGKQRFLGEAAASIARSTSSLPNLGGGASRALASLP